MFGRIKEIIKREKHKHEAENGIILLLKRVWEVARIRMRQKIVYFTKNSTFSSKSEMYMCSLFPKTVLDLVIGELRPSSILDIGCGTGISLKYFIDNQIDALGVENSIVAIAQSLVKHNIIRFNLNNELDLKRKFDLVWSFEVIEHIHPYYESNFLKTLTNHSSTIILSAAKPGQGGHGHFNEQEAPYWIKKFNKLGYYFDEEFSEVLRATGEMHAENLLCFKKMDHK